jgi:DNA-binding NtrC family response regulator
MKNELVPSVLYVDDEFHNLAAFKANFRHYYKIFVAISALEARQILLEQEIHIIITDQKMPGETGVQLLETAVKEHPLPTRIILSAHSDKDAIIEAVNKGLIFKYLLKPFDPDELKRIIDDAFEVYFLKKIKEELYKEWLQSNDDLNHFK